MKKIYAFMAATCAGAMILYSCASDENYYLKDIKSNERSVLQVKVPKQIGNAEIKSTVLERTIKVSVQPGSDLTALVPDIQISANASISPSPKEAYNFAANENKRVYTVTSETGQKQDWTLEIHEYDFDMNGTWKIDMVQYQYNVSVLYGADDWKGTKQLKDPLPGFAAELDNTLSFTLLGATADGNLYGTFVNDAGVDGENGTFVWHGSNTTDFAYKFDKVPSGSGTWFRNLTDNTITFNKGTTNQSVTLSLSFQDEKQTILIPFNPGAKDIVWDNDWGRMELQCTEKFWYTIKKI